MSNELVLLQTPYPDVCFSSLVGIRGICENVKIKPNYWVDDIPGISLEKLALTAGSDAPSGAKLGAKLLNTAARMLAADVERIYDGKFRLEANLVSGCSSCKYLANYATGNERGTMVMDRTTSNFSRLLIDKLTAKLNATGTFHVVLDDGSDDNVQVFEHAFVAGVEQDFVNIGYKTKSKKVRIYLEEPDVPLAQLSCPPKSSNCGCGGKRAAIEDLVYTGTFNGAETQQAYGFKPCAFIQCDGADLLCYMAKAAPRMVGMALLYKFAELYFTDVPLNTRNNRVVNTNVEDKVDEGKKYAGIYRDQLQGSKGGRGIKDVVTDTLKHISDVCIICDTPVRAQWATG